MNSIVGIVEGGYRVMWVAVRGVVLIGLLLGLSTAAHTQSGTNAPPEEKAISAPAGPTVGTSFPTPEVKQAAIGEVKGWLLDWGLRTFPIIIGLMALLFGGFGLMAVGWVKKIISDRVDETVQKTHREIYATSAAVQALALWRQNPKGNIDEVIGITEDTLRQLKPDDNRIWLTKNNLAYYYAEAAYVTNAAEAVRLAQDLKARYLVEKDFDYLTTYARVVAAYFRYFPDQKRTVLEAKQVMEELQARPDCPLKHQKSARTHADALGEILRKETFGAP